jgi:hypothetical protein
MSLTNDPPFALGQTLGVSSATDGTGWVGAIKQFPDVDPTTGAIRSNRLKTCIAVRNSSGVALLPKRVVVFSSGSLSDVDGYAADTGVPPAGVVDEHLNSSGVANNDVFWLTVSGPTEVKLGPAQQAAADATLVALTAATSTVATTAGQAQTAANAALQVHYIGRALSAGTTGENVLAVVNLVRS